MGSLSSVMMGAVAMASAVATLFFLRFWRQTKDDFFLLFALAFGIDAGTRAIMGVAQFPDEAEPFIFLTRLLMFALIILAIIRKNRPQ